jgi:hypothetical protein
VVSDIFVPITVKSWGGQPSLHPPPPAPHSPKWFLMKLV